MTFHTAGMLQVPGHYSFNVALWVASEEQQEIPEVSTRKGPSKQVCLLDWYAESHLVAVLRSCWATRTLSSSAEDFLAEGAVGRWRSSWERGVTWVPLKGLASRWAYAPPHPTPHPPPPRTFPTAVSCPCAWVQTQQSYGLVWRRDGKGTCGRTFTRIFQTLWVCGRQGRDRASIRTFFPFRCSLRCCYSNRKWLRCWWGKNGPDRFEV